MNIWLVVVVLLKPFVIMLAVVKLAASSNYGFSKFLVLLATSGK